MLFLVHASACHSKVAHKAAAPAAAADPAIRPGTTVPLTIVGFNYTDRNINEFTVDGASGGNLFVSSTGGGGGGSVCCSSYTTANPAPEIKVRWQSDACLYNIWHEKGREFSDIHSIYKTQFVKVESVSPNPKYLEIHIFPDGHVEAAITDSISRPRLVLDENRRVNTPFMKCPDGRPAEKPVGETTSGHN